MNSRNLNILITIILTMFVAGSVSYVYKKDTQRSVAQTAPTEKTTTTKSSTTSIITIMIPSDKVAYQKTVDNMNSGDQAAVKPSDMPFIKKLLTIPKPSENPTTSEIMKATAYAAANEIFTPGGGPDHAEVAYLKTVKNTAYILLNIDVDGWAGVSFTQSKIRPLIEKTLLLFPGITKVVFGLAPGDTMPSI
ncbi:MAG: hypothetical protein NTX63_00330 [Candidatus Peregrinibacteria bacterium]|nr:hypothetical protein [Candidatus Peregrinibacteria bacterium]